ncbi:PE family protein [Mycobacterium uberis]|uniref:PE family protein n=1 Tax=Mycobacterium uberis TaxID=2162698 RepID=UPI001FB1A77D|nr:PE family protein [Mycobacterium uberis]
MVPTTGMLAVGADEVSSAIAALFGTYAQGYQELSVQAAAFHQQFVQAFPSACKYLCLRRGGQCIAVADVGAGHVRFD